MTILAKVRQKSEQIDDDHNGDKEFTNDINGKRDNEDEVF